MSEGDGGRGTPHPPATARVDDGVPSTFSQRSWPSSPISSASPWPYWRFAAGISVLTVMAVLLRRAPSASPTVVILVEDAAVERREDQGNIVSSSVPPLAPITNSGGGRIQTADSLPSTRDPRNQRSYAMTPSSFFPSLSCNLSDLLPVALPVSRYLDVFDEFFSTADLQASARRRTRTNRSRRESPDDDDSRGDDEEGLSGVLFNASRWRGGFNLWRSLHPTLIGRLDAVTSTPDSIVGGVVYPISQGGGGAASGSCRGVIVLQQTGGCDGGDATVPPSKSTPLTHDESMDEWVRQVAGATSFHVRINGLNDVTYGTTRYVAMRSEDGNEGRRASASSSSSSTSTSSSCYYVSAFELRQAGDYELSVAIEQRSYYSVEEKRPSFYSFRHPPLATLVNVTTDGTNENEESSSSSAAHTTAGPSPSPATKSYPLVCRRTSTPRVRKATEQAGLLSSPRTSSSSQSRLGGSVSDATASPTRHGLWYWNHASRGFPAAVALTSYQRGLRGAPGSYFGETAAAAASAIVTSPRPLAYFPWRGWDWLYLTPEQLILLASAPVANTPTTTTSTTIEPSMMLLRSGGPRATSTTVTNNGTTSSGQRRRESINDTTSRQRGVPIDDGEGDERRFFKPSAHPGAMKRCGLWQRRPADVARPLRVLFQGDSQIRGVYQHLVAVVNNERPSLEKGKTTYFATLRAGGDNDVASSLPPGFTARYVWDAYLARFLEMGQRQMAAEASSSSRSAAASLTRPPQSMPDDTINKNASNITTTVEGATIVEGTSEAAAPALSGFAAVRQPAPTEFPGLPPISVETQDCVYNHVHVVEHDLLRDYDVIILQVGSWPAFCGWSMVRFWDHWRNVTNVIKWLTVTHRKRVIVLTNPASAFGDKRSTACVSALPSTDWGPSSICNIWCCVSMACWGMPTQTTSGRGWRGAATRPPHLRPRLMLKDGGETRRSRRQTAATPPPSYVVRLGRRLRLHYCPLSIGFRCRCRSRFCTRATACTMSTPRCYSTSWIASRTACAGSRRRRIDSYHLSRE